MIFKLVKIDYNYCNYLRRFDSRVIYNYGSKELRTFVGVLFSIEDKEYFAPLCSLKSKHIHLRNTIDFFKLDDGLLGAINFNNMIPVKEENYEIIYLNKEKDLKEEKEYQILLKKTINVVKKLY